MPWHSAATLMFLTLAAAGLAGPRLAAAEYILNTLASFNGSNGFGPIGSLVRDSQGNLFGTTCCGGADEGTVFELSPVPEPGSLGLLCLGLASLAAWATRARNAVREQRNKRAD